MSNETINYNIDKSIRLCIVDNEIGYFHTWEHYSTPIAPSIYVGGNSGGLFSRIYGIVEFRDCVRRVEVDKIHFCDAEHVKLNVISNKENKIEEFTIKIEELQCEKSSI